VLEENLLVGMVVFDIGFVLVELNTRLLLQCNFLQVLQLSRARDQRLYRDIDALVCGLVDKNLRVFAKM